MLLFFKLWLFYLGGVDIVNIIGGGLGFGELLVEEYIQDGLGRGGFEPVLKLGGVCTLDIVGEAIKLLL